ncbi:MAG: translation initiation factor [Polyangiales bacterium]
MISSRPKSLADALQHLLPQGQERAVVSSPASLDPFAGKVVLSVSRKGRGGRTVTIVSGLRGTDEVLEAQCRELKKALGCGASIDDGAIVVAGNALDRVKGWLEAQGAKKVIVGT